MVEEVGGRNARLASENSFWGVPIVRVGKVDAKGVRRAGGFVLVGIG